MKIINQKHFRDSLLELFNTELSKYSEAFKDLSNIDNLTISFRRKKICEYMINNIEHNIKNAISKIESNDILNSIIHEEDVDNISIDIFKDIDISSSNGDTIAKSIILYNDKQEHIAYINIEDFLEDNIFTNTQLPLNLFLVKFNFDDLKIVFLHNKINNSKNIEESKNQTKNLKHFQKHFKFKNLMLRAHISSINKIDNLKLCHLIKIKKYGNLFAFNEHIFESTISLFSDFKDRNIRHILRNYRNLIKIENKLYLKNSFDFKLMATIRSFDINKCVLSENKDKRIKLFIFINALNFHDVLDSNVFLMHSISNKQEETNFKLKDFLKQPKDVIETIGLIHY